MESPVDYWSHLAATPSPLDTFLGGQQQARAAQLQQQQIVAQNLAQAQAQEQARRQREQADRQAAALEAVMRAPTAANIAKYQLVAPDHAAQIKSAYDTLHTDAQEGELKYASNLNGLLTAGDIDGAKAALQRRIDADKAAGVDTADEEHALDLLNNGGKDGARAVLGLTRLGLAAVAGPDHAAQNIVALDANDRANALAPGAVAAQAAQTALQKAEAAKAGYLTVNQGDTVLKIDGAGEAPQPAPAPAAQNAPQPAQDAPARPIPGPVGDKITQAAEAAGATPDELAYLHATARIESNGQPSAKNGSSTGVFQFHPDTFAQVGGGNIADVGDQTQAAINLAKQNSAALTPILGEAPTGAQLYLAHQQGATGAGALLSAPPETNAISALEGTGMSPSRARASIMRNGGTANMTAGDFVQKWEQKYNEAAGTPVPGGGPTVAQANQAAGSATPGSGLSVAYQGAKAPDEQSLSPEAVAMVGEQYLRLGPTALQNMGQGRNGINNKARVMEWAANAAREAGTTNPELVARFVQNKANTQALSNMTKNLSAITASEGTLAANADFALRLAQQGGLGPTGVPLLDTPWNKLRQNLGSADAKAYDNALVTVANEYAKVLTTATGTGGGATSDSARQEAQRLLNSGMSLRQIIAAINVAKTEAENRRASLSGEVQRLTQEISGTTPPAGPATGAATPAAPAATVLRFDAHGNPIR